MATQKKTTDKTEKTPQRATQGQDEGTEKTVYDGTEGEQEPGVDVAPPNPPGEGSGLPENRSDDRSMSLHIAKEQPRHELALENAGIEVSEQHETFEYQVVTLPQGEAQETDPGPDNAAVTAALNAGYRTTGEAELSGPQDHPDGVSLVWTWKVPVIKVKGPVRDGGLDNAKVSDRHDDAAKTPLENLEERDAEAKALSDEEAEFQSRQARTTKKLDADESTADTKATARKSSSK